MSDPSNASEEAKLGNQALACATRAEEIDSKNPEALQVIAISYGKLQPFETN